MAELAELIFASLNYGLIASLMLIYGYLRSRFLYWRRRGIVHAEPSLIGGNLSGVGVRRHMRDICRETYDDFKDTGNPFCGFYFMLQPAAFVLDVNLANRVLAETRNEPEAGDNAAGDFVVQLNDSDLSMLRSWQRIVALRLAGDNVPQMLPRMVKVGTDLRRVCGQLHALDPEIEVCSLLARYSADMLGACFYDLDSYHLDHIDAPCPLYNPAMFPGGKLSLAMAQSLPPLTRQLWKRERCAEVLDFETAPTVLALALYELAAHEALQQQLRAEIVAVLAHHGNKLSHAALLKMSYLRQVILETLRKYAVRPQLQRIALNDITTATPGYTIAKDTLILLPVDAMHNDAQIFPEPNKFKPERFASGECVASWLPLANEQRLSFGQRFALMECRIGLTTLLRAYEFSLCRRTPRRIECDPKLSLIAPTDEIYLRTVQLIK